MNSLAILRQKVQERGWYARPTARVMGELAIHLALVGGGIVCCASGHGVGSMAVGLVLLTIGGLGVGTNAHSASHHATSRSRRINQVITYLGFPFFLMVSASWWRYQHLSSHHPSPNMVGVDQDIDFHGWFRFTDRDARSVLDRVPRPLRWGAVAVILALFLLALQVSGVIHLAQQLRDPHARRGSHAIDLLVLLLGVLAWYVLPALYYPAGHVIAWNAVRMVLLSLAVFAAFGPAHWPAEAVAVDARLRGEDPLLLWTSTTIDFRTGPIGRFFCSGLDCHIEHHLFPDVSYVHYPALRLLVEEYCRERNYPYRRLGWGEAILKSVANMIHGKPVVQSRSELLSLGGVRTPDRTSEPCRDDEGHAG